jgi:hypothetical protein
MYVWAKFHFFREMFWENSKVFGFWMQIQQNFLYFNKISPNFQHQKNEKIIMEGLHLHQKYCFQNIYCIYFIIWCLWPFIEAFCILIWTHGFSNISKYWQGNSLGTWNDQMYVTTYAFSMCTRIITILMQMNQNSWKYNIFNEKPRTNQISKIITSWLFSKNQFY